LCEAVISLGERRRVGGREELRAVKLVLLADAAEGRRVGDIALLCPDGAEQRARQPELPRFRRRQDEPRGQVGRGREEGRMQIEGNVEKAAPALELEETIGLALRRPLGERQAARGAEDLAVVGGLADDGRALARRDRAQALMAEIGPGRDRREVIVDDAVLAHPAPRSKRRASASRPCHRRRSQ
jgi:hypothetical protein